MGNIVLLDDLTINKIAAGEVIERPASVVKELVENSIDAGATNINVEIKNGGISYIRITDNGKGIMPDDMEIAFERHATSKIRSASDLETVKSMGFRGEALASVAAISKIEMISKTADNDVGYKINVQAGKIIDKEEKGCSKGTTITVTDLFFNTPVRYKFLKKDFTEAGYIEDVMTRIALIHPEIAIKLISSGKTIIQTSGNGDIKSIVYNIYGKDIADNIIETNYEYEDIKITGVVGKPAIARSNRGNQMFFVNKRFIKDKILTSATEQAFKGLLTIGKYGFLILNIEMNPSKVDVNVHPAKLEVRFQDENTIFKAVYHAIKETLLKGELVPEDRPVEIKKQIEETPEPTTEERKETIKFSDLLQKMLTKNRAYEVNKGETQKLFDTWLEKCKKLLEKSNSKEFKQSIYDIVNDFEKIELDTSVKKPKVGIVGEVLIKYHPFGNNYVADILEKEGAEVILPDFMGFAKFMCTHKITFNSLLNTNKTSSKIMKTAIKLIDLLEKDVKIALANSKKGYLQPCDIWHLEDKVKNVLSIGNQTGEGWFLTAEMIEYIENDIPNIICVQPFACLPNHVVGKGVIKTIRSLYPEANISPVDYDPGASEANQTNRIKLLMTVAKDNLKAKENAKKLIEKENSTDAKKEKIKINN